MPSPATVNDVRLQFGEVSPAAHNLTVVASSGNDELPPASFANGVMVWLVSYEPDDVLGDALGAGGVPTVGVIVALVV